MNKNVFSSVFRRYIMFFFFFTCVIIFYLNNILDEFSLSALLSFKSINHILCTQPVRKKDYIFMMAHLPSVPNQTWNPSQGETIFRRRTTDNGYSCSWFVFIFRDFIKPQIFELLFAFSVPNVTPEYLCGLKMKSHWRCFKHGQIPWPSPTG